MPADTSVRPVSARRTVISAALTAWVYRGINLVTGIVTLPLIAVHLGKDELGVWMLVGSLVSFVSLSDFGIGSSIARFVARFRQTDREQLSILLSTAVAILTLIAGCLIVLTVAVAGYVPQFLRVPPELAADTQVAFLMSAGAASLLLVLRIASGILAGHQRYGPHGIGKILESLFSFFAIVLLVISEQLDLRNLAIATAGVSIASNIALVWIAWRMTGPWDLSYTRLRAAMAREIFSLGISSLGLSLSTMFYVQGIAVLVGITYGLQAAAIYGVSLLLANNIQALLSSFGVSFSTLASEWQERNEMARAITPIRAVSAATSVLGACALAGLVAYGEPLLRTLFHHSDWSRDDYRNAHMLLLAMCGGMTLGLPYTAIKATLLGTGLHWRVFGWSFCAAVCAVVFAALAAFLQAPLWVIGASWCIVWFLPAMTVFVAAQANHAGIMPLQVVWQVHAPAVLAGGLLSAVGLILQSWWPLSNLPALLSQLAICLIAGVGLTLISVRRNVLHLLPNR